MRPSRTTVVLVIALFNAIAIPITFFVAQGREDRTIERVCANQNLYIATFIRTKSDVGYAAERNPGLTAGEKAFIRGRLDNGRRVLRELRCINGEPVSVEKVRELDRRLSADVRPPGPIKGR